MIKHLVKHSILLHSTRQFCLLNQLFPFVKLLYYYIHFKKGYTSPKGMNSNVSMFISIETAQKDWSKYCIILHTEEAFRFIYKGLQEFMLVLTARQTDSHRQPDRHRATNTLPTNIPIHPHNQTDSQIVIRWPATKHARRKNEASICDHASDCT